MCLPQAFVEEIRQFPGLAQALELPPSVSIRHNKLKSDYVSKCPVPWCIEGEYLESRPDFTLDPAMHQGLYYAQDASSMSIAAATKDICGGKKVTLLDLCAAPGGKTTAAISSLQPGSLVVSNEYDYKRAEILAENVAKWGYPDTMITRGNVSKICSIHSAFDVVLVDAPCSGEGMMRKDSKAKEQWSPFLVEQCAKLQRDILANAWEALKPGGALVYSTCTFNSKENDDNLQWLIDSFGAESINLPSLDKFVSEIGENCIVKGENKNVHCYRFLPGRVKGEGLFLAAVRKPFDINGASGKPMKIKSIFKFLDKDRIGYVNHMIKEASNYSLLVNNDSIYAVSNSHLDFCQSLASVCDVLSIGTHVATIKGRDIVPVQQLALSKLIDVNAFNNVEVSYSDALAFLRRQNIAVDAPIGYVLLTYQSVPLGFVKNLGNRSNNLYPKNWRILKQQ